ncbi:hypothetical protein Rs2_30850 [Raphanus sativus]|nr:hypothetical protein Rs2_30850 [Raphanus sativus]
MDIWLRLWGRAGSYLVAVAGFRFYGSAQARWSGRDVFCGRVRVSFDSLDGCSPKLRQICIDPESRDFQYSRWEWLSVVLVVSRLNPEFTLYCCSATSFIWE